MVLIEQEPDAEGTREAPSNASSGDASAEGGNGDDEESFEDALTEEKLRKKALKQTNNAKEEGNKLFRIGQHEDALLQYEITLQIASELPSSVDVCSMSHGNRAACFLKLHRRAVTRHASGGHLMRVTLIGFTAAAARNSPFFNNSTEGDKKYEKSYRVGSCK